MMVPGVGNAKRYPTPPAARRLVSAALAAAAMLAVVFPVTDPAWAAASPCAATPALATPVTRTAAPVGTPLPAESAIGPEVNPPGDIPDNQAFVPYTSASGGYTISMPEGWARQESASGVSFVDKLHQFSVEIGCASLAPTVDSATNEAAASLARQVPAFELVKIVAVELPGGPGVLIQFRANSAPDEVTGKQIRLDVDRYELFKDGRLAVITLAAPAGSDNVDVSNQVSRSFQWLP